MPQTTSKHRPPTVTATLIALGFLGLTALGGGIEMLLFPGGNRYVPAEWLDGIPFVESWLLPGLILGIGFGIGSLVTAYGLLRRPRWTWLDRLTRRTAHHWSWASTGFIGGGLLLWILLEVILIPERSVTEAIYGSIGIALLLLPRSASLRGYLSLTTDPKGLNREMWPR